MESKDLYSQLESDFIKPGMTDDWVKYMGSVEDFLCKNFKERSMGLVCDFADSVERVFTAVFPEKKTMQQILDSGVANAMLFVHHPSIWDIRNAPEIFYQMDVDMLEKFREKRISIYNLHVPLDDYGEYSTSVTLTNALGLKPEKAFFPYNGGLAGVIARTELKTVSQLKKRFEEVVGHRVKLYRYGDENIKGGRVSIIAGGGHLLEAMKEITDEGINTHLSGVTVKNEYSSEVHEFDEKNRTNLLGGTHYSTEKFACIAMCSYFKGLGLTCEFIEGKPLFDDL